MTTLDVPLVLPARGRRSSPTPDRGRVPKAARLMAAAIRGDELLRSRAVPNQAALAARFGLTRARVTQVMSLLHLAPDLQEAVLFLPPVAAGRDRLALRHLLPLAAELDWRAQRRAWARLAAERGLGG